MPLYNYECLVCKKKLQRKLKRQKRDKWTPDEYEQLVLFETSHSYDPTPKELADTVICPRCDSRECEKTLYGSNFIGYIRGNGYLDKDGCHRDMNLHTLDVNDPYSEYRVAGEVDDLKVQLKRAGQHDAKPKHFVQDAGMEKAMEKVINPKE